MAEAEALQICSRAMVLLGADSVVEFGDGTNEALVAEAHYETTYKSVLTEHRWNATVMQGQASQEVEAPDDRFAKSYVLPAPILVIDRISPDHIDYELFSDRRILTDYDGALWVEGQYRIDEKDLPPYLSEYLEYRLAAKFAFPVTGDETVADRMYDLAMKYQKMAKSADSKQRKGVGIKGFPLINVRG